MKGTAGWLCLPVLAAVLALPGPSAAALALPPGPGPLGDPTPYAPNAVRATYSTRILDSLEGFAIDVDLRILEVEVPPLGGHTAAELRAAPSPLRDLFEAGVRDAIRAEAERVLPDARVTLESLRFDYGAEDYDADPFAPPIRIHAGLSAAFTAPFFGLPASTQTPPADLARAFLYSGGAYLLAKEIQVPAGYDVRHIVGVPSFLVLQEGRADAQSRLEFHKDNFAGVEAGSVRLDFGVRLREGAVPPNVLAGPLVKAVFLVDDATPLWKQAIPFTGGDYRGDLDLEIHVHSLDASLFANYPLPRQLGLTQVSADLLRIVLREGLVADADVKQFFDSLIRRSLEEGFGPQMQLAFDWGAFDRSLVAPVGGADGSTVEPLLVRARAVLPFASSKMLVSSGMGRVFSMTLGMSGGFDLNNDGMWNADYTVAYPRGVHVRVRDSAGLVEDHNWGEREGFRVLLARGAATHVQVEGRTDFDPVVFLLGLVEIVLAGWAIHAVVRQIRGYRRRRSVPGSA